MGASGYASDAERREAWLIDRAKVFLEAGASMIMSGSKGITGNVKS